MRRLLAAGAVVAAVAGCGSLEDVTRGGRVAGNTLTVYSLLPAPGQGNARDIVDGEKLALFDAGGTAGPYAINFISISEGPAAGGAVDGSSGPAGGGGAVDGSSGPAAGGGAVDGAVGKKVALALRGAIADPQIIALIGPGGSDTATATVPLFNAAGILEITPGAGYPGFTEPVTPGEPERWRPSGRPTLARLTGDDTQQARALLAAAAEASGRRDPRVAIEQEPGRVADALVAALRSAGANVAGDPARADAVVYAGEDPETAAAVADGIAREAPDAAVVLPDAVTRAGVAARLSPAARRRTVLVTSAPEPGSTPALRRFEQHFRERIGREPGPYAAVGYEAMRSLLAAIDRAGDRANRRQAVIDAYFDGGLRRGTLLGDYRILPDGAREPASFRGSGS